MKVELIAYVFNVGDEQFYLSFYVNNISIKELTLQPVSLDIRVAELILRKIFPDQPDTIDTFKSMFMEDFLSKWQKRGSGRRVLRFDFKEWIEYRLKLRNKTAGEVINAA